MSDYKLANQLRNKRQKSIAISVWKQQNQKDNKQVDKYDQKLFNKGIEWFNSGLTIDDAPDEIRNNSNFVNGFNKGSRIASINNAIYNDGKNWFFNGFSLNEVSEKMKTNPFFIKGYQDAENLGKNLEDLSSGFKR